MCVNYFYPFLWGNKQVKSSDHSGEGFTKLLHMISVHKNLLYLLISHSFIYFLTWYDVFASPLKHNAAHGTWTISSSYDFLPHRQWPSQKCFEQALACISYILTWGLALMAFIDSCHCILCLGHANKQVHQVWWHTLAMPARGEQRQEDHDSSRPA